MPDFTAFKSGFAGDIAFITKKEFQSKIRTNEGVQTGTGDVATLTANTGKDMYITSAKCSYAQESAEKDAFLVTVVLKINGTIVETCMYSSDGAGAGSGQGTGITCFEYNFKNIGLKVEASEIIKLEVTVTDADITVEGFIQCFEEDTGVDPTI